MNVHHTKNPVVWIEFTTCVPKSRTTTNCVNLVSNLWYTYYVLYVPFSKLYDILDVTAHIICSFVSADARPMLNVSLIRLLDFANGRLMLNVGLLKGCQLCMFLHHLHQAALFLMSLVHLIGTQCALHYYKGESLCVSITHSSHISKRLKFSWR